jgi:GT2 family glycosyltransferase
VGTQQEERATGTWAVVVNWNGGEENLACLRSLLAQGLAEERVVFVDNGSRDGSRERVSGEFPALRTIDNDSNLGFGRGVNQGVELALAEGAEAVLLVNNDVTLEDGTLAALRDELERSPEVGIVGPRVVYRDEPERLWAAGGRVTWRQNLTDLIGHRGPDRPEYQRTFDVDYVVGCALLARRAVFERVGLLDDAFFAYHEDVDFCLRAGAAGFGVRTVGGVRALHAAHHATGGGYNARRKYMMGVNTIWFLRRHGTPLRWLGFVLFDVLTLPLAWLLRAPRGEGAAVRAKARGTWHGLRGRRVTAAAAEEA